MDLHESDYLKAIQAIPGSRPGEKYRELNLIAKKAVDEAKSHGDVVIPPLSLDGVPEPLKPLVRLKIGKLLQQNEAVAEGLKSEDCETVNLALRTKWFFQADNNEVINVEYFKKNLYPWITLKTRTKLIKRLTRSLRSSGNTNLAEEFYNFTCESYGKIQAAPLLPACSESFIWTAIISQKLVLSCRMVRILFDKYPELVVCYLKLTKPVEKCEEVVRNVHRIDIRKYRFFLPRLINNHVKSLIELIAKHDSSFGIELSNKATERFLKSNVEVVLNRPNLFKCMIPPKVIATKVSKSQYKEMLKNAFPPDIRTFKYSRVQEYFEHLPKQERSSLLLETYSEVYNADLLDNHDIITAQIMKMLPVDERVRQARIKLAEELDCNETYTRVEQKWRCYLPIDKIIPTIKKDISNSSSPEKRSQLLQQLFYVCSINDDKEALLEALSYFTTRHRNERTHVISDVLGCLVEHDNLSAFDKDHWSVMIDFLKFLNVQHELARQPTVSMKIFTASTYFNLTHDLPIDENIEILVELKMQCYRGKWCMFEKNPEYDRLCFDKMMSLIPYKYPSHNEIWERSTESIMSKIAQSMADYNERNTNKSNNTKQEKLSMKKYPWMLNTIEKMMMGTLKKEQDRFETILKYLEKWEVDLYKELIPRVFYGIEDVTSVRVLKQLKEEPIAILNQCDEYWKAITEKILLSKITQRFVKASQWYADIPIAFFSLCRQSLRGNNKVGESLMVLAILMHGSEFADVIEPLVPQEEKRIDGVHENPISNYNVLSTIPRAMNLANPPVPLALVNSFCDGDFLKLGLTALLSVSRRTSVQLVEKFAKQLADNRVSVRKHGIRLFCLVATIKDYEDFLVFLWRTDKHRSIRFIILQNIHRLFLDDPSPQYWKMLKDCFLDLQVSDNDILNILEKFDDIPNDYITEYTSLLLESFEKLKADGLKDMYIVPRVCRYLHRITPVISRLLTDEFLEKLMKKYFCNFTITPQLLEAGMHYTFNTYLRGDRTKLDSRLLIFSNFFVDKLREQLNEPDSEELASLPVIRMINNFVEEYVCSIANDEENVKIMKSILKSFVLVLKPQQDWTTYALLTFGTAFCTGMSPESAGENIAQTLPHFVETFSSVMVIELADIITKLIKRNCINIEYEDLLCKIVETLCDVATSDSCTLAAKLLFLNTCVRDDVPYEISREAIVEKLINCPYPVAVSLVYQAIKNASIKSQLH